MKLIRKYRVLTYTSLSLVVAIGFMVNYELFRTVTQRTTDNVLRERRIDIEEFAEHHGTLAPLVAINSLFSEIVPIRPGTEAIAEGGAIADTLVYSLYQEKDIVYRKLVFPVTTPDGCFRVKLMLPLLIEADVIGTVFVSLMVFVLLFIVLTTFIDMAFTRQIFKPFHQILEGVKSYPIGERSPLVLKDSHIDEFHDLSRILTEMMNRINKGYYEMKDFLEYTSHEIKTPLSIIQLKIDVLNQQNFQNPEVLNCIGSMQNALKRVVRFNRSVLFIAKIRNDQFTARQPVSCRQQIACHLEQFDELLNIRRIRVTIDDRADYVLKLHPLLADHLMQNLFSNAIKHNHEGGYIRIRLSAEGLQMTNSYDDPIPKGDLFAKYTYNLNRKESNGLGLSIIKTICEKNGISVTCQVTDDAFSICLSASPDTAGGDPTALQ